MALRLDKKFCRRCSRHLGLPSFGRNKRERDGLEYRCKSCRHDDTVADRKRKQKYDSAYRSAHAAELAVSKAAYYAANRDAELEKRRQYSRSNSEAAVARAAAWNRENVERRRQISLKSEAKRRAILHSVLVEAVDPQIVWIRDEGICRLCDQPAESTDWHLEHLTPIARGGKHGYANTAVSHPSCNYRKHTMTLEEWKARNA